MRRCSKRSGASRKNVGSRLIKPVHASAMEAANTEPSIVPPIVRTEAPRADGVMRSVGTTAPRRAGRAEVGRAPAQPTVATSNASPTSAILFIANRARAFRSVRTRTTRRSRSGPTGRTRDGRARSQ